MAGMYYSVSFLIFCFFRVEAGLINKPQKNKKTLAPKTETYYIINMRIISKKMLRDFWEIHPDEKQNKLIGK